jgi:hypothetical protein
VEKVLGLDAVGNILHIAKRIHQAALLGAQDQVVKVSIYYGGSQPFKLRNQLKM